MRANAYALPRSNAPRSQAERPHRGVCHASERVPRMILLPRRVGSEMGRSGNKCGASCQANAGMQRAEPLSICKLHVHVPAHGTGFASEAWPRRYPPPPLDTPVVRATEAARWMGSWMRARAIRATGARRARSPARRVLAIPIADRHSAPRIRFASMRSVFRAAARVGAATSKATTSPPALRSRRSPRSTRRIWIATATSWLPSKDATAHRRATACAR